MTWGKGMAPFRGIAELKHAAQPKKLDVTNVNTKVGPSSRQIGIPINNSFL